MSKRRQQFIEPHPFRSVVGGESCKHRHMLYREARDCGYRRTKGGKAGTWESHVVDAAGDVIESSRGGMIDMLREERLREERQGARREEMARLRDQQREIDRKQWWNPLRPRDQGES